MTEKKKREREERQRLLLSQFQGDFYQEKKIGQEWYVKMFNGGTKKWQVAVFTEASFKRYKMYEKPQESETKEAPYIPFERPTLESLKKFTEQK